MATTATTTTTLRRILSRNNFRRFGSTRNSLRSLGGATKNYTSSSSSSSTFSVVYGRRSIASLQSSSSSSSSSSLLLQRERLGWNGSRRWQTSYPSHEVVGMPSLSPTMEAGTISSWSISEGESFSAGDVLCEIETDKATMAFEAQDDGVCAKILADAGNAEIQCGVPILITVEEEEDVDAFREYVVEAGVGGGGEESAAAPAVVEVSKPEAAAALQAAAPAAAPAAPAPTTSGERTIASPLAWSLAKENGYDLSQIAIVGTGPDGRIIAEDVREYVPLPATAATTTATPDVAAAAASTPPPIQHDGYTDYPLSPSSIHAANLLTHSKQTVPHYYLTVDITLDSLLALRNRLNTTTSSTITLDDLLLKATACAMKSCPDANASWMGDSVRRYDSVDVNYIMGNGSTLYAPRIPSVESRGLSSISTQIAECLERITPEEGEEEVNPASVAGMNDEVGTVTVMNLGMYGVKSCAPIIREPQAVALALGVVENRVVPREGEVGEGEEEWEVKVMVTATLSCDHRVVDGAVGAGWLSAFKAAVENPDVLLL